MRFLLLFVTSCLVLGLASPLRADEVVKKDGSSVFGFIVRETSRMVLVLDAKGRRIRIMRTEIESVIESAQTGDEEVDAKLDEIDTDDADELVKIAAWAKDNKNKSWKIVVHLALRADETHDEAHELLGHIKVGDEWFRDKRKAAKAKKALVAKEMKEQGYVKWKGGWISKEDKALASKDPKAFVKDDNGLWREKSEVMKERGFILAGDKWVKGGTPEDNSDMKRFKELLGEDIWIVTTKHFRLYIQQYPPDKVNEFAELVEVVYDWFLKEFNLPEGHDVFRGNKGHMWVFREKGVAMDWFKNYRNRFSLSDTFEKLLESGGGNILSSGLPIALAVPTQDEDVRHPLVNHAAHFLLQWHSPGLQDERRSWLREGFGVHAEHVHLGNGYVVHSTLAKYGGSGGKADKGFATKDAEDRSKGQVREGSDEPIENLNKIELNQLSGDHISKAYTLVKWLLETRHDEFIAWMKLCNTNKVMDALTKAFKDLTPDAMDKAWRKMVKKNF